VTDDRQPAPSSVPLVWHPGGRRVGRAGRFIGIEWEGAGVTNASLFSGFVNTQEAKFLLGPEMWEWYAVELILLREIPGVPVATRQSPEMTHELMIFALDPKSLGGKESEPLKYSMLQPVNVVAQFSCDDDQRIRTAVDMAVDACIDGYLSLEAGWEVGVTGVFHSDLDGSEPPKVDPAATLKLGGGKVVTEAWSKFVKSVIDA
jgi:hypothetical protein